MNLGHWGSYYSSFHVIYLFYYCVAPPRHIEIFFWIKKKKYGNDLNVYKTDKTRNFFYRLLLFV